MTKKTRNWIRVLVALLLAAACLNISMPWRALKRTVSELAQEDEKSKQDNKGEDKDSQEEREEREERDADEYEKEFLTSHHEVRIQSSWSENWYSQEDFGSTRPVMDILAPPPRS